MIGNYSLKAGGALSPNHSPLGPTLGRQMAVTLSLVLAGCGSDVESLLAQDSALFWVANESVTEASAFDPALAGPVTKAEAVKQIACARIYAAMSARVAAGEPSLGDRVVDTMSALFVRVVPVPSVERCAVAIAAYRDAVASLERTLQTAAVPVPLSTVLVSETQSAAPRSH